MTYYETLKDILFRHLERAGEKYVRLAADEEVLESVLAMQRQRIQALYNVVKEAGLNNDYIIWKYGGVFDEEE